MPEVHWSRRAKAKLEIIDPVVRDQLTSNAGEILHHMPPAGSPHDEGFEGEIMWHRGIPCGTLSQGLLEQEGDGPWNYFLFYRRPVPEKPGPGRHFEVLDICSVADIAKRWRR